jgi:hypothetical protein
MTEINLIPTYLNLFRYDKFIINDIIIYDIDDKEQQKLYNIADKIFNKIQIIPQNYNFKNCCIC